MAHSRLLTTIAAFCVLWAAPGLAESPSDLLQKGIYAEETAGDLDSAMRIYGQIVRDTQATRAAIAEAYYRLGVCYGKKKQTKEAVTVFQQLVVTFPDQPTLVAKAQAGLTKLGAPMPASPNGQATASVPPSVVSTNPVAGASDVDPALDKITITFDQDMGGGFSWTGGGPEFPQTTGKSTWIDKRTAVLPVKLEAAKYYRLGINSTSFQNFCSAAGVPVRPGTIYFTTRGADAQAVARMKTPTVTKLDPPNGSADVDPARGSISITFDSKMGDGMSWCGGGPTFPEMAGKITWSVDHTVCTMPVKLKPGQTYQIGVNSPSNRNFMSESGVSVEPVEWTFKTK
jgi:hypothetical protein